MRQDVSKRIWYEVDVMPVVWAGLVLPQAAAGNVVLERVEADVARRHARRKRLAHLRCGSGSAATP